MGLFKPKWKHSDPDVRKEAVKKIEDQGLLKNIAKNDVVDLVRMEAVKRLEDQNTIADISKHDEKEYVRETAVEKLEDQEALACKE